MTLEKTGAASLRALVEGGSLVSVVAATLLRWSRYLSVARARASAIYTIPFGFENGLETDSGFGRPLSVLESQREHARVVGTPTGTNRVPEMAGE